MSPMDMAWTISTASARTGKYLGTFGGKDAPWNFDQCHKIAIDSRFSPVRLLCTDRRHDRLVHMDLDGRVIGIHAEGLRYPSALAVYKDELAVAELKGRVSILDKSGRIIASLGTNENVDEIRTNKARPGDLAQRAVLCAARDRL